jgi:hypothetical protein
VKDDTYLCAAAGYSCSAFVARTAELAALNYARHYDVENGAKIHVINKDFCCHEGWFVVSRGEIAVKPYGREATS